MRLIDVSGYVLKSGEIHWVEYGEHSISIHIEPLYKIPAVDAVPVKHGRWITEKLNCYTSITKCSVCGKSAPFVCKSDDYYGVHMYGETEKTLYCPNCGAKMDLEEQDAKEET